MHVRRREDIAVVGYACRFPQAPDADAFWALLREGRDAVTEVAHIPDRIWRPAFERHRRLGLALLQAL